MDPKQVFEGRHHLTDTNLFRSDGNGCVNNDIQYILSKLIQF